MDIQLAVGLWIDLWEIEHNNRDKPSENKDEPLSPRDQIPLLFEKGMSIPGIAEVLSNKETIVIDDKKIPIVLDSDSVAMDLLYYYVVRQNVPKITIFTHHKYVPIVNIIGFQNTLQCIVTTVTPINDNQEFQVRVDRGLYQSILQTLQSLS